MGLKSKAAESGQEFLLQHSCFGDNISGVCSAGILLSSASEITQEHNFVTAQGQVTLQSKNKQRFHVCESKMAQSRRLSVMLPVIQDKTSRKSHT